MKALRILAKERTPFTFLIILFGELGETERLIERIERRRNKREQFGYNIRFRIWDQAYLTSLVHQFPQIAFKYFSDEGRFAPKQGSRMKSFIMRIPTWFPDRSN